MYCSMSMVTLWNSIHRLKSQNHLMKHNKPYITKSLFLCSDEQKERVNAREGSLLRRNITRQPTLARGRTFFTRDGSWAKGEAVRCLVYCVPLTNSVKTLLQSFLTSFFPAPSRSGLQGTLASVGEGSSCLETVPLRSEGRDVMDDACGEGSRRYIRGN